MANERLPIKFFAKREMDKLSVEGMGSKDDPNWVLTGSGLDAISSRLCLDFSEVELDFLQQTKKGSALPYVFSVDIAKDSTAKSRRQYIADLFQFRNKNNIVGFGGANELLVKLESANEASELSKRLKDKEGNRRAISCLASIHKFSPKVEAGLERQNYKVKLIDYQDYEQNLAVKRFFEKTVKQQEVAFRKTEYSERVTIYKLFDLNKAALDKLRDTVVFDALFSIEPMPKYAVNLDSLDEESSIPSIQPQDDKDYGILGVLDSGISSIPSLAKWLEGTRWTVYPPAELDTSHGTFVSGVALYGDHFEGQNWIGNNSGIKLFDAAVFPKNAGGGIEEDELIDNIREAIAANCERVKIWNLSLSVNREVDQEAFSDFAIALDAIQDKFGVLICKSAGNCGNFLSNKPKGKIHAGADSIRSLVVGSIAHKEEIGDLSKIDNPSPFSRIGPGPSYVIKPEVVHYGGNAGITPSGGLHATGVKSFSVNGDISTAIGTSFSTPRISSLAVGLSQEIDEEFDPLLLKTLIIHSSTYSKNLETPNEERTKQMGFGRPGNIREILYNSPHEATLILRDNLAKKDFIDIMDFPMPPGLVVDGYYTGQIIVTLVYDPIIDPSQRIEYCQSNLDVKFGTYDSRVERDTEKKNIINPVGRKDPQNVLLETFFSKNKMKSKADDFAQRERLLIKYGDKYYPVKKYAIDLSEVTENTRIKYLGMDRSWFLWLKGIYRDHVVRKAQDEARFLSQEFCLAVTIRDPLKKTKVYDEVSQKLDEYNFWHSNIKVSADVKISV